MKAKGEHSSPTVRLMESDPSAYFEKLLQELDELEQWIDEREDEVFSAPTHRQRRAKR